MIFDESDLFDPSAAFHELSEQTKLHVHTVVEWVKEEMDENPKSFGTNYGHFLYQHSKVLSHQTGIEAWKMGSIVNEQFKTRYNRDIHGYSAEMWKSYLFKPDPQGRWPDCELSENRVGEEQEFDAGHER